MGEEVTLSWTKEEEKKFRDIVKANPQSQKKCFWLEMFKALPAKSISDLVIYYWNVFLLQRREYQNRCNSGDIDSLQLRSLLVKHIETTVLKSSTAQGEL
ncbi:AT-rich interactive domain-containing protein [Drosera capensis]